MKQDVGKVGEIERLLCLDHQVQMELCYERNKKKIEMLNPLNRVEFTRWDSSKFTFRSSGNFYSVSLVSLALK